MPAARKAGRLTSQPQFPANIDWSNPITRGLSFAAIPVGATMFDCVTKVFGTVTGAITPAVVGNGGNGKSHVSAVRAVLGAANVNTNKIVWPASSTLRGAGMVNEGTILALAATSTQVDNFQYVMGGNTESTINGDGFSLLIDSYSQIGRGNIQKGRYNGANTTSATQLLGTPFVGQLEFFGYAFSGNGANGDWFSSGINTPFTGQATNGTLQTNRHAVALCPSDATSGLGPRGDSYLALLLFWDRRLRPEEYAALYINPWQVIRASRHRWAIGGALGLPTLSSVTYTPGTLTSSGYGVRVTAA